jgi:hypothetical protein
MSCFYRNDNLRADHIVCNSSMLYFIPISYPVPAAGLHNPEHDLLNVITVNQPA